MLCGHPRSERKTADAMPREHLAEVCRRRGSRIYCFKALEQHHAPVESREKPSSLRAFSLMFLNFIE
jgi:hypothetical protein